MFLVFAGSNYYPDGGWEDFEGVFPTLEAALGAVTNGRKSDWWHIVDLSTLKIVRLGYVE